MLSAALYLFALTLSAVEGCPGIEKHLEKRAEVANNTAISPIQIWDYDASYDWAKLNPDWELCQTGTQQSPIPLRLDQGLSLDNSITFNYPRNVTGDFYNWGYGPAFSVNASLNSLARPNVTFRENGRNVTAFLSQWHIHSPADHTVQGDRSKSELHFVHTDSDGKYRAVVAFRIDPGNSNSPFFNQLPNYIHYNQTNKRERNINLNHNLAIAEVNNYSDFWTYRGSLTSPPCTEGVRWFVARQVLFVSDRQMQAMLRVSAYSARAEQEVWRHAINA